VTPGRPGAYLSEIKNKPPPDRRNNNYRRLPAPRRYGAAPIRSASVAEECKRERERLALHFSNSGTTAAAAAATTTTTAIVVIGHNDIKILLLLLL